MLLTALLVFIGPRFALVGLWLLSDDAHEAFSSSLWPILGFVFVPWTTLCYVAGFASGGISGIWWVLVAVGLMLDVSAYQRAREYVTAPAPETTERWGVPVGWPDNVPRG